MFVEIINIDEFKSLINDLELFNENKRMGMYILEILLCNVCFLYMVVLFLLNYLN